MNQTVVTTAAPAGGTPVEGPAGMVTAEPPPERRSITSSTTWPMNRNLQSGRQMDRQGGWPCGQGDEGRQAGGQTARQLALPCKEGMHAWCLAQQARAALPRRG